MVAGIYGADPQLLSLEATMPLFTLCLAALSGRESFSPRKLVGVLLAVGGVAVLLMGTARNTGSAGPRPALQPWFA